MKNSHGYDEISTKIKKVSTSYILAPLTYICNKVLSTGVLDQNTQKLNLYLRKAIKWVFLITGPFSCLPLFLKLLKIFYTKDCMIV